MKEQTKNNDNIELIKEMRKLLALLMKGNMQSVNPKDVIKYLHDESHKPLIVGEQRDIFEIFSSFKE